ncbi:MAG: MFS transporter [Candidatus Micrarchaeota archaeon]|nr:MFS transporter [Candidatus Micrarchaeota archaeon]
MKYEITLTKEIGLKHLFLLPSYKNEIWFLAFVALMNFTVQFASPFFTPYMLNTLHMEVSTLGMLTAIAIVAKVISYRYWGKAIDRFSNRTVLITTSLLAPIVPLLWLLSGDVWMLALFQVFSGFVWSGYEIAVFNTALSMVGRELRPSFISKYNAFSAFANGLGAIAGGAFLLLFPNLFVLGFSGILLVFLLSGLMRLAVSAVFAPKLAKSKDVENLTDERAVIFKLIAVYPTLGAVSQVQNGWDFTRKIVRDGAQNSGIMLHEGIEATEEIVREEGRKLITKISRRGRL